MKLTTILNKLRTQTASLRQAVLLSVCLALALPQGAWAASPTLVNVGVAAKGNHITVSAVLTDSFPEEVLSAIESGVPMTFTFNIELRKDVALWADSLVGSNTVHHTVQYDSLKKVYRFTETGENITRKLMTRKRERYQKMMAMLDDIPLAPLYRLNPNDKYYIRVKADLHIDRFWFPFNYLLFFVPFNEMETTWARSSLLSLDPELEETQEAFNPASAKSNARPPGALKHVIKTFNQ
ncbi:MAG: DUF4390 domain-containing protein [Candidatus Nitrohelix vancouverensis]|uniref:DUF4390 domain-containing protein n=1 Tax=Candidatus Nitrohelix vancouverensis TaxID=2705534 RepID=A0A7T0C2S5_9BACT|nr:MAG: DUF4390 domain-containing protein [Candidatus Nitrohelix vancouverensis]